MTANGQVDLARVLDRTSHLLLDFDGPICNIFARLPAPTIAAELRNILRTEGASLPKRLIDEDDPIEVLRLASTLEPALIGRVEAALSQAEITASQSAQPTPYARDVILACNRAGRAVAIVSNNSEAAVRNYLTIHRLTQHVGAIVGRTEHNPTRLKPDPHPILRAVKALGADPETCTLVGDSISDIEGAQAAAIFSVGYANKPGKREQLTRAGADAVITTMDDLVTALSVTTAEPQ